MTDFTEGETIHPIISQHLKAQGVISREAQLRFLNPVLSELPSPFLMKDMERAVELIVKAMHRKTRIVIWGDYDVDGICGTALLVLFLRAYGVAVTSHIPNRLSDGYGLSSRGIDALSAGSDEPLLLITVDCGISNQEEISYAREKGFEVIITDHHQPPAEGVAADAVLNPKLQSCSFPFSELSGAGVAFYFASAIRARLRKEKDLFTTTKEPNMKSFMGLVALGTIADVVPLVEVNRILTRAGLERTCFQLTPGMSTMLESLGVASDALTAETVAFQIAPAINAAGRLGEPETALELLLSDELTGDQTSHSLKRLNEKRKKIGAADFEKADQMCRGLEATGKKACVVRGDFHDGVLGITASKLVEKYGMIALVCCNDAEGQIVKGSARAPAGIDLYRVIRSCSRFLAKFGGHKAAAGFSLPGKDFEGFKRAIEDAAHLEFVTRSQHNEAQVKNYLHLPVSEAFNSLLLKNLFELEPVGEGNPKPIFTDRVQFVSIQQFGRNKEHLRGVIRGRYKNVPFIGFNQHLGVLSEIRERGALIHYSLFRDSYNGAVSWKIKLEELFP